MLEVLTVIITLQPMIHLYSRESALETKSVRPNVPTFEVSPAPDPDWATLGFWVRVWIFKITTLTQSPQKGFYFSAHNTNVELELEFILRYCFLSFQTLNV